MERKSKSQKKFSLASIYKKHFLSYLENPKKPITEDIFKAVNQTLACRTARLGVNIYKCDACNETKYILRSCKNRFCPRCGYADTQLWAKNLLDKLAPTPHHHIVLTLPAQLRKIGLLNKTQFHSLLLKSASECIMNWFAAKYNITPGIVNVLHTAGSDQKYHPHVHMLCSTGGLTPNLKFKKIPNSWYLINQKFLSEKFRLYFKNGLLELFNKGELKSEYQSESSFNKYLLQLDTVDWVVNVQPSLKNPQHIVNYVGRYSKRTCLSEYNIIGMEGDYISFRHKNYRQVDHKGKAEIVVARLHYRDFFARLFEHVPPKRFRSVRYYGVYTNCKIAALHAVLKRNPIAKKKTDWRSYQIKKTGQDPLCCKACREEMEFKGEHYDDRPYKLRLQLQGVPEEEWSSLV